MGRVRELPKFEKSGSGMSGIEKTWVRSGIFGFGNFQTHHYFILRGITVNMLLENGEENGSHTR